MHLQKTLILILFLVAASAGLARAADCDVNVMAIRLVADATAELQIPEFVAAVTENGGIRLARDVVTVEVAAEECPSAHVLVTIVKALGKGALKGAATLIRRVL
ncbi:MAG: hypothetical protein ACE5EO_08740 [Candidatus Krumholzibacteriia bacterium]